MVALGCIAETFETAVTWDRFEDLHEQVTSTARRSLDSLCGGGTITCRFTHVYPDGAAPYFTVLAPSRHGEQLAMWDEVKAAVSEAIIDAGATITHHHSVGRDHRAGYDRQRPDLFAEALAAAKATLDPAGVLNPGVLIDP
jgi:alkyldihydroxyacetonephosphate synthase